MSSASLRAFRRRVQAATAMAAGEYGRIAGLPDAMQWCALSPEQVRERQLADLRRVLSHAGATVPYWREVFAQIGFRPQEVSHEDDLRVLPVLTKDIVRAEAERLISDTVDRKRLLRRTTGGSTAEPLVFWVLPEEYEAQLAIGQRSFALVGIEPGDAVAKVWGYKKPQRMGNAIAPLTGKLFLSAFDTSPEALDEWLRLMERTPPDMIYGYASALHAFARHCSRRGVRPPGLRAVCSTAEKLFDEQRAQIVEGLGAPVFDMYGCHEIPRLASECRNHRMHVCPDAAVLEFVDSEGGEPGPRKLLLTSLLSYAMPLIRYDVGDYAQPDPEPCTCGLPFSCLRMDMGKVHHMFALPGGRTLHTSALFQPLYAIEALAAFQMRHVSLDTIEIWLVAHPGQQAAAAAAVADALPVLRKRVGDDVNIREVWVDQIPRTRVGKQPIVVSDVPEDTRWN